ncbi:hypothetical protein [Streptomyces sp. NPDC003032]
MRRGVRNVLGASAAVMCLGGLLAACGGESGDGYVATGAVGAGGAAGSSPGAAVGPTGDVRLIPLDGAGGGTKDSGGGAEDARGDSAGAPPGAGEGAPGSSGEGGREGKPPTAQGSSPPGGLAGPGGAGAGPSAGNPGGPPPPSSPSRPSPPSPPGAEKPGPAKPPGGPAALSVGAPDREPADKRWCERVTVTFRNTGGSPVRSGTVTFGTHIIGALGVDWDTVESTVRLPAPIAPGGKKEKTWPVCVDAWRVPLGMRVETQDVSVEWK